LALVANSPAKQGLLKIDTTTGETKVVGPAHDVLFGPGDLVTTAHDSLYYLGDSSRGATLLRMNLSTGEEICSAAVNLKEISFVSKYTLSLVSHYYF
jgi:hypothetical protein